MVVELTSLKGLGDWPVMRKEMEAAVTSVLGKMPKERVDLQAKVMDETDFPGYVRRRINYFVDEWNRVSAWMFVPEGSEDRPAVLCMHGLTSLGKAEPAGMDGGDPMLAFARHYAERGYVTLAPDCITCGERVYSRLEPFDTELFYKDNPKMSVMGKMLLDHMSCVELLAETQEVDPARIGAIGHDMGSYNALFLAAFDDRISACVASCGITSFVEDSEPERWAQEAGFVLMPKLRSAIESREYPFDWDQILALVAPSPTLLITALNDELLPNTRSVDKAMKRALKIYKMLGAGSAIANLTHRDGHRMTPEALGAADNWFERWL